MRVKSSVPLENLSTYHEEVPVLECFQRCSVSHFPVKDGPG